MRLFINGESRDISAAAGGPFTIAGLLVALELGGKRVAVEHNGAVVPRSQHGEVTVAEGDRFEIIVAVGGG